MLCFVLRRLLAKCLQLVSAKTIDDRPGESYFAVDSALSKMCHRPSYSKFPYNPAGTWFLIRGISSGCAESPIAATRDQVEGQSRERGSCRELIRAKNDAGCAERNAASRTGDVGRDSKGSSTFVRRLFLPPANRCVSADSSGRSHENLGFT